jgi:hypothetical protein
MRRHVALALCAASAIACAGAAFGQVYPARPVGVVMVSHPGFPPKTAKALKVTVPRRPETLRRDHALREDRAAIAGKA